MPVWSSRGEGSARWTSTRMSLGSSPAFRPSVIGTRSVRLPEACTTPAPTPGTTVGRPLTRLMRAMQVAEPTATSPVRRLTTTIDHVASAGATRNETRARASRARRSMGLPPRPFYSSRVRWSARRALFLTAQDDEARALGGRVVGVAGVEGLGDARLGVGQVRARVDVEVLPQAGVDRLPEVLERRAREQRDRARGGRARLLQRQVDHALQVLALEVAAQAGDGRRPHGEGLD